MVVVSATSSAQSRCRDGVSVCHHTSNRISPVSQMIPLRKEQQYHMRQAVKSEKANQTAIAKDFSIKPAGNWCHRASAVQPEVSSKVDRSRVAARKRRMTGLSPEIGRSVRNIQNNVLSYQVD